MSKTVTVMQNNIGNMVQDTSTAFKAILTVFINDKYREAWRRCLWSASLRDDYTFESVVGTATYVLPGDFEEEVCVADVANGHALKRDTVGNWWRDNAGSYSADALSNGNPKRYVILENTIVSGSPYGAIKLDPPPDTAETYAMPYKKKFTPLLQSSGSAITGTCTTNTDSKVIASASTFITHGVQPGMRLKNTTDGTYGYVSTVDSETQLTMLTDVCPSGNETFTIADTILIPDLDWIVELGATGEAWAYKRQFNKSAYFLQRFAIELDKRVGQEQSKANQLYLFESADYRTTGTSRLLGDKSYDSL